MMSIEGCSWRRADNRRAPGWEQVRKRLAGDSGLPLLYFTDKCEDTIRTLPVLQHSDTNPEDLDTEAEDHAADETRYALMSRPWIPGQSAPKATRLHKNPSEYTINELVAKQTAKRKASEDF